MSRLQLKKRFKYKKQKRKNLGNKLKKKKKWTIDGISAKTVNELFVIYLLLSKIE